MMTKYLLVVAFSFILLSTNAQSVEEYKKIHAKIIADIPDTKLQLFVTSFSMALVNYDWKTSRQFFDEEHYSMQMKLYLNDDFMFGHLGKVGKRDTAVVHLFYMRETLGFTLDEQERRISNPDISNLVELNDFVSISRVYFINKELVQVDGTADLSYYDFTLMVITEDGKTYLGKCWIDSQKLKIYGAVG